MTVSVERLLENLRARLLCPRVGDPPGLEVFLRLRPHNSVLL